MGFAGAGYLAVAAVMHGLFILSAVKVLNETGHRFAKLMFGYSIFYLFALFAAMMLDRVVT
jgi:protoheme IX farnesyltransferase